MDDPSAQGRTAVGRLISDRPVVLDGSASIAEAARAMSDARSSAAVIEGAAGLRIVTDVDLRELLAAGTDPASPARTVAHSATSVEPSTLQGEALYLMLRGGFHHLPVVQDGRVLGVLTETMLIADGSASPFSVRAAIVAAPDREAAVEAALGVPAAVAALVAARFDPVAVGHVVGAAIDALTARLLDLAIEEFGEPPAPWAWLAVGSLGRHEQALHTDQDHALVYDAAIADEAAFDEPFAAIAESVTAGLEAAGLPRCEGHFMAVNPQLRRSLPGLLGSIADWSVAPDIVRIGTVAILADARRVAGTFDAEPAINEAMGRLRSAPGFLRRLSRIGLEHRPPLRSFGRLEVSREPEHRGRVDVKGHGILAISDLARFHMLETGTHAERTLERLRLAVEHDVLREEQRAALEESFRLLWLLRLQHQVEAASVGSEPDDWIDPDALTRVTRRALREAYRVISEAQRSLELASWAATP